MGALFRFVDVRCAASDRAYGFTLHAGETRQLQLVSRQDKDAVLDAATGAAVCASGSIEIVQGERRQRKVAIGKLAERRHNSGPLPLIWQAVSECRPGRVAWVAADGGLISNLRIWENVTLPLWYHTRRDFTATEQSVSHWLGVLGMEQGEFAAFMAAPPHGVDPWQRKLAGLLRAVLQQSPVLVVDGALFDDVRTRLANCWMAALAACANEGRAVLVISDKATSLTWDKIE